MKRIVLFLIIQAFCCSKGYTENPRWNDARLTPIPARADLDVRWDASTINFPPKVWVYHLLPNTFSPEVVSNVLNLCSFTEKDRLEQSTNGLTFQSSDRSRKLSISFPSGTIHYEVASRQYGPTNLAEGVPEMSRMPELTTNFIQKIGIHLSEITGYFGSNKFEVSEPHHTMYYVAKTVITNIDYRRGYFRRCVDGIAILGGDEGGIDYGEHGGIAKLSLVWRSLERYKIYPTVPRETLIGFLRQGKARQGLVSGDVGAIYWPGVKSVTIKKALPRYSAGDTDWLYPFAALWTTVDTGRGNVDVVIECPIIDESKPLNSPEAK